MENRKRALRVAGALAVCLVGGALCAAWGTPLPWMIGPLVCMAIVQFSGADLEAPPLGREAGQVAVGVTLGLYFTPPVVREVAAYGGYFGLLGFLTLGAGALCAQVIARLARVDAATAWFSSMPGGAAEMAVLGERHGALADRVALANALRMLFVVTLVPVFITLAGFSGAEDYQPVTIALTVGGVSLSPVPTPVTNAAQLLLACSLGVQFHQSFLREAPRFVAALVPAGTLMLLLCGAVAVGLAWASGAYLGAMLLALAPGGIAEMSITAQVLNIGVPFVTAAHVCRYVIVIVFAQPLFRLLHGR